MHELIGSEFKLHSLLSETYVLLIDLLEDSKFYSDLLKSPMNRI